MGVATWRLRLERVRVVRQRENSGDRPYFASLVFRSCLGGAGTSVVDLVEREPHDWVSKAEYRGGVSLSRGDHMSAGESLAIPGWMGEFSFGGMPLTDVSPAGAPLGSPWIFGVVIFSFDNNNTPPHVIRNILNTVRENLLGVLRSSVERVSPLGNAVGTLSNGIGNFRNAFQLSVGSTFNPDKSTGVQVRAWWGTDGPLSLPGLPTSTSTTSDFSLLGEQVQIGQTWTNPAPATFTLRFAGSGGVYDVAARVERVGGETVSWTRINSRRSPISLAACDNGRVYVLDADGTLVSTDGAVVSGPWQVHGRLSNAAHLAGAGSTIFILGRDRQLYTLPAPTGTAETPRRAGRPYAAGTIGGGLNGSFPRVWALNEPDHALYHNDFFGADGRWTHVGRPGLARHIAGAAASVFALNEDRSLWMSPTGRDDSWHIIGRPFAAVEITGTAPASGTPILLYALNEDGSLWRGTVSP